MHKLLIFFENQNPILSAGIATSFGWFLTAIGASLVFFFKKINRVFFDTMLAFTGGVMIAASFWSLLNPAIHMSQGSGFTKTIPVAVGFMLGSLFMFLLDKLLPHLHVNFEKNNAEGIKNSFKKTTLLILSITLHNIPEGLAVGVLFGGAYIGLKGATYYSAITLAIGIGLQNLPEGIAVAMPLRRLKLSRKKCFFLGQLSAIVEPIAGMIGASAVLFFQPLLPYALSFAAGSMIFVVIEEVIPETQLDTNTDLATLGFILGFMIMMILDVGLS